MIDPLTSQTDATNRTVEHAAGSMLAGGILAEALDLDGTTAANAALNETLNNFLTREDIQQKQARLSGATTGQEREAIQNEYRQKSLSSLKLAEQKLIAGDVMTRTELEQVRDGLSGLLDTPLNTETRSQVESSIREISGLLARNANQSLAEPIIIVLGALPLINAGVEVLAARVLGAKGTGEVIADAGSVKGINPTGSMQNCTNCVAVVDNLLTTGNTASALPRATPVQFSQLGELGVSRILCKRGLS